MLKPRVGHINFLNVLPLTYSYQNGYAEGLDMTCDVPSVLNNKIRNNQLDISPVSSIAYARQSDKLMLLPNLCIRADCDVTSIVLMSKKPIEEVTDDKIILTSKSETSHCLIKIILSESYNANPTYEIRNIDTEKAVPDDASAALFIGDDALYFYLNTPKNLYCYDIGKEWYKLTGQSMVYAVWTVRRSFAEKYPDVLNFAYNKIVSGIQNGLKNKNMAIESVLSKKPFSYKELDKYLEGIIKWDLPKDKLKALLTYYRLAHKFKMIEKVPDIEIANISSEQYGHIHQAYQ